MRGYFAFLVVFVSVFLLISISQSISASYSVFDKSRNIAIEQNYQIQLNIKYSIVESAWQESRKAVLTYFLLHLGEPMDLNDAKEFVRYRAFSSVKDMADNMGEIFPVDSYDIIIWCGYTNDAEINSLKKQMVMNKKALICADCVPITNEKCVEFFNLDITDGVFSNLWIGANKPMDFFNKGIVGVSVYDKKFDISGSGYIPQSERRSLK